MPWLFSSRIRNILSSPFIYAMIMPIAFFDITTMFHQHICFRLYGIRRVKRSDYMVMDRHQLAYLNGIEKLNCVYCGYGKGVVAYTREVIARKVLALIGVTTSLPITTMPIITRYS